ncbi:MAG TPA: C-terminal binding protein [Chloroflexota bacterium]|nr:C-terminal binding protein [Chloroflexota bacterium]
MGYSVIATAFPGRVDNSYPYEHEALRPLGITVTTVDADSDSAYVAQIKDADAIIVGSRALNADIISQLNACKVIANGGIGVDRVDLDAATAKGIVVTNVPDVFVDEVANHAMMLLLCLAKKTVPLDRCVRENRWRQARQYLAPMPKLTNQVLGLVAFGNIPRKVAPRARGFDMHVLAWDPFVSDETFAQHGVERVNDLLELFGRSDFVSAHLPLNKDTHGLLDYALFSVMKPTAYFINTGRGPTHVESDLIRALNEKKLAGAGLDVMEHEPTLPGNPLHEMDNVVLTPHVASVSDVSDVERRRRVGQEIAAVLQGRMPRSVVNNEVLAKVNLSEPIGAPA